MPGGIPICVFEPDLKLFRVLHAKGKCFSSGGYGVSRVDDGTLLDKDSPSSQPPSTLNSCDEMNQVENGPKEENRNSNAAPPSQETQEASKTVQSSEYLFVEEALFLHERGLIDVYDQDEKLDSSRLYNLLSELDVPLSVYLVYAHLRAQTFIALRHTPKRLDLLQQVALIQQEASIENDEEESMKQWKKRKHYTDIQVATRELRKDARNAPIPKVISHESNNVQDMIAFDVHRPNSSFRKTNPGPPDFYVAITHYSLPSPTMTMLLDLTIACQGISLQIATVADSGTVVMFGLSNVGVPVLTEKNESRDYKDTRKPN